DRDDRTALSFASHTKTKTSTCTKTEMRTRERTSTSTSTSTSTMSVRTSARPMPEPALEPAPQAEPMPGSGRSLPAVLNVRPGVAHDAINGIVRTGKGWKVDKHSGGDWYSRGMELHRAERYDEAIEAFQKSIEDGHKEGASSYNIACGYALKGDADKAFEWLHRAMDAGFEVSSYLGRDDDLESLESDPRWKELKKEARAHKSTREQDQTRSTVARYG